MPENEVDPARNTQQFQAFVQKGGDSGAVETPKTNTGLILGLVALVAVLAVVAVVLIVM